MSSTYVQTCRAVAFYGALLLIFISLTAFLGYAFRPSALLYILFGLALILYLKDFTRGCILLLTFIPILPAISLIGDFLGTTLPYDFHGRISPISSFSLLALAASFALLFSGWKKSTITYLSSFMLALPFSMGFSAFMAHLITVPVQYMDTPIDPIFLLLIPIAMGSLLFVYESERGPHNPPFSGAPIFVGIFFLYLNLREISTVWDITKFEIDPLTNEERLRYIIVLFCVELSIAFLLFSHLLFRLRLQAHRHRRTASNLKGILDSSFEAIIGLNRRGQVLYANAPCKEIIGVAPKSLLDNYLFRFLDFQDPDLVESVLAGEKLITENKETILKPDGSEAHLKVGCRRIESDDLDPDAVLVLHDMTNEANSEKELVEALRSLRQNVLHLKQARKNELLAGMTKNKFLAELSRAMRAPLCGIEELSELLLKTPLTDAQKTYVGKLTGSSKELDKLIGKLFDIMKIRSGLYEVRYEPLSLAELMERTAKELSFDASLKNNVIQVDSDALPKVVIGDVHALEIIFKELISSAIKSTENGSITVSGKLLEEEEFTFKIGFMVKDTGSPLSEKLLSNLMEERPMTGEEAGLPLVKELVELHDGTLEFRSLEGEGTAAYFLLSFDKVELSDLITET